MAGVGLDTKITVGFVVMANADTPLVETGKEARHTVAPTMIPDDPKKGEEMFLALAHDGAVNLWGRELKQIWYPETARDSSPPSTASSPT